MHGGPFRRLRERAAGSSWRTMPPSLSRGPDTVSGPSFSSLTPRRPRGTGTGRSNISRSSVSATLLRTATQRSLRASRYRLADLNFHLVAGKGIHAELDARRSTPSAAATRPSREIIGRERIATKWPQVVSYILVIVPPPSPDHKGALGHGVGICVRRKRRSVGRRQVPGSGVGRGCPRSGLACFVPARRAIALSLAPRSNRLPNGRKGSAIHMMSCAPGRNRTYGLLLRRHFLDIA